MNFSAKEFVIKISVSDMATSRKFYETVLGFKVDPRYSIINNPEETAYIQMNLATTDGNKIIFGLFNDISEPFEPIPQNGSVPSFIVENIDSTLEHFKEKKVVIDKIEGEIILKNTSDMGYIDRFFFFRDPDNNSLVIRENLVKKD